MNTITPNRFPRNHTLDILRAVFSWAVVLVHVAWINGVQGQTQHDIGVMAVESFLVLSGFVITQLIITKRESYATFIFRRFMRLFPVFLVCLLIALAMRPLLVNVIPTQGIQEQSENQFFWPHLLAHLSLLHGAVPTSWLPSAPYAFLPPAWSISLEFQLYLVAPLLVWWLSRSGLRGMLPVLALSALCLFPPVYAKIAHSWDGIGAFLPQRLFFFVAGSLLYLSSTKGPRQTTLYQYRPFFIRLGEISYSTYLIHWPILVIIVRFIPHDWPRWEKLLVTFSAGAPIILVSSLLLYSCVEKPGIELGKWLSRPRRVARVPLVTAVVPES